MNASMTPLKIGALAALVLAAAGCTNGYYNQPRGMTTSDEFYASHDVPFVTVDDRKASIREMDGARTVAEQDCSRAIRVDAGNLRCK